MKEEEAIKRIGEQIGKSNIMDYDLTTNLLNKFQEELAKLKKEGKFDNKTYLSLVIGCNTTNRKKKLSDESSTIWQT